jgi:hypothetical protein
MQIESITIADNDGVGVRVAVTVRNSGERISRHVVQLYPRQPGNRRAATPTLVGFATSGSIAAGDCRTVIISPSLSPLRAMAERRMDTPAGPDRTARMLPRRRSRRSFSLGRVTLRRRRSSSVIAPSLITSQLRPYRDTLPGDDCLVFAMSTTTRQLGPLDCRPIGRPPH